MSEFVIDTNVPIVANGRNYENLDQEPSVACRLATINFLQEVLDQHVILLDLGGEIQLEYATYLNVRGQPGVGDRFFLEIINSHPERIRRIQIDKGADGEFLDLPLPLKQIAFDPSDRKFAAIASKSNAVIANAIDSDWIDAADALVASNITVSNLCGCSREDWFRR